MAARSFDPAHLEGLRWQRQHRGLVDHEALRLCLGLSPDPTEQIGVAAGGEVLVHLGERGEPRHRDEQVPPRVADVGLHVALLVAPPDPAEVVPEEEVTLEAQELGGELALVAHHLRDRDRGVVITGARRHATEERKGGHVAGLEGLGALAGIGRNEVGIRVGKRHHRQRGLCLDARDLDRCLAEVELRLSRWVREGHEDLLGVVLGPGDGRSHLRGAPRVAVFVPEPLIDALGRVTLLWRSGPVGFQDLVDHGKELTEHRLRASGPLAIAGRFGVRQDLLECPSADPVVPSDRALRSALHEHLAPDLCPHLHVGVHPSPVFSLDSQAKPVGGFEQAGGWSGAPLFDQRVLSLRCSPFGSAFTTWRARTR